VTLMTRGYAESVHCGRRISVSYIDGSPSWLVTAFTCLPFCPRSYCEDARQFVCTHRRKELGASALVALDLIERHAAVGGVFAWKAQHPFADDVARDLGGATAERRGLSRQVSLALAEHVVAFVDHS
jgi:hypothetical protein